ncbi:MAG: OmpA family protein [Alphaproteobacteria bacterium]|nr:OmpA family protein [Alphaproteobacteria bacterium]
MPTASLTASDTVAAPEPEPVPVAPVVAVLEPTSTVTPSVEAPEAPEAIALEPETVSAPPPLPDPVTQTAPGVEPASETVPEAQEVETAAVTTGPPSIEPGRAMQIVYTKSDADIPAESEDALSAVAEAIKANEDLRVQLMAFAGGSDLSSSKARRLSLSRALSVRSYFIGQGVRSTRIDVRALGDKTDENPINRVDINITQR